MTFWRKSVFDTLYHHFKKLRSLLRIGKKHSPDPAGPCSLDCRAKQELCCQLLYITYLLVCPPHSIATWRGRSVPVQFPSWKMSAWKDGKDLKKRDMESKRWVLSILHFLIRVKPSAEPDMHSSLRDTGCLFSSTGRRFYFSHWYKQ